MEKERYLIVLCNSGGELDRRTASTPEEARNRVIELAAAVDEFYDGDSIRVIEQ